MGRAFLACCIALSDSRAWPSYGDVKGTGQCALEPKLGLRPVMRRDGPDLLHFEQLKAVA
jgi:hypothetical protein